MAEDDDEDEEMEDVDEDEMDLDAEGEEEEDAEGEEDVEMTPVQPAPAIKNSKSAKASPSSKKTKQVTPKKAAGQTAAIDAENSDDDELSDLDSDDEDLNLGDEDAEGEEEDEEMDAEGEEIEEPDADGEAEEDTTAIPAAAELDSDDDGSRGETPDLSKMTQRQRARFEGLDESHYQALSNGMYWNLYGVSTPGPFNSLIGYVCTEVQAKKTFTVEEKAMRRAEMARRRRNLSEKRNEEVKVCSLTEVQTEPLVLTFVGPITNSIFPTAARDNQQVAQEASQQDQPQKSCSYRRGGTRNGRRRN